ncbi:hypothetical protein AQUCO_08200033v1 [Aquilegia coerulea]|uniref:Uncharacterized protein n=1 Tax=Aquilegia coerulea TaxID=218851 RepID=A0A2G5C7L0_AQUCA|nr:hypothetical protein AQUCO_08200033v1 [Aquilegia coerulea]
MDSFSTVSSKKGLQSPAGSQSSSSSPSFRSNSFPSNPYDLPPFSPLPSYQLSNVPFSWEQHPGIPKTSDHHSSKSSDSSLSILPLPPSAASTPKKRFNVETVFTIGKKNTYGRLDSDPFATALVECSKGVDDHQQEVEKYWKVSRVVSNRLGFIDRYTSCKKSCAVAESVILLPRAIRKA